MATHMLNIKRIYDNPADDDGYRILVDRIWPRGVSKERAKLDRWAKTEVTPTTDLRKWFAHDPAKFDEFKARYIEQLNSRPEAAQFADDVRNLLHDANITLLYAARDPHINHVVILRDWLWNGSPDTYAHILAHARSASRPLQRLPAITKHAFS